MTGSFFLWTILALSVPWNVLSLDDTYDDMMRNAFDVPTQEEVRQANKFLRKEFKFMFQGGKEGSLSSHTFYDVVNPTSDKYRKDDPSNTQFHTSDSPSVFVASDICLNHTGLIMEGLQNEEEWALRVIDASGKIGSGMLDGNFRWFGSFDECLAVRGYYLGQEIFKGKYCTANVPITLIGCMGWSWYLANDMQFFVISPLLLVPLYYSFKIGTVINALCLLGCWIASGIISAHYELPASKYTPGQSPEYNDKYYIPPHTRIGPYIVGVYAGYLLYRTKDGFKMSKMVNMIGWLVAAAAACLVLYGLTDAVRSQEKLDVDLAAFYNAVHRSVWGACLCWVIFTCARGYGGFVNELLSWKAFVPLGRLSYMAYLIHQIIINVAYRSTRTGIYVTEIDAVYLFLGNMVASYAISYVVSLAFESPMMGLEKALLHGKKK